MCLESYSTVQSKLADNMELVQENIVDRIGHGIALMVTGDEKLFIQLKQLKDYPLGKTQETENIEQPGWGRVFNSSAKRVIEFQDVHYRVSELIKTLHSQEYQHVIDDCISIMNTVADAMNKHLFSTKTELIQKISEETENVNNLSLHVREKFKMPRLLSYDPDFKPLTAQQASKLIETILDSMDDDRVEKRLQALVVSYNRMRNMLGWNYALHAAKFLAEDLRLATALIRKITPTLRLIYDIYKLRKEMSYSSKEYVFMSFH